jgi:hypothetical protein
MLWVNVVAERPQGVEQFARYQMHLAEIGKARSPAGQIPVPNEGASVRVSFDAMLFYQDDGALRRPLAEMMPFIGRHGHDSPFELQIQHGCSIQNHAAWANDRRVRRGTS